MTLEAEISKADVNKLPLGEFTGTTHLIDTVEALEKALEQMAPHPILGFDTETRPAFKKGVSYPISLLQFASADEAWLIRLNKTGFPEELAKFLERDQIKVGVAVKNDVVGLQKLHDFDGKYIVDLSTIAKNNKLVSQGLRPLMAICHGVRISKGAKISNWAAETLNNGQIRYAATDAWAGFKIYEKFVAEGFKV